MPSKHAKLFRSDFIERLRDWIATHHKVYPHHPPQGIYFESLVERAFLHSGWQRSEVRVAAEDHRVTYSHFFDLRKMSQ